MLVKAYLILKVIKNKTIFILEDNTNGGQLVSVELNSDQDIQNQITAHLKTNYNLIYDWLDIKHVSTKVFDNHLGIFYSTFVPLEFIDEKTIKYIKDYSSLSIEIGEEIQRSLRLSAY